MTPPRPGNARLWQRHALHHLGRQLGMGLVVQQVLQAGMFGDVRQLGSGQAPVQRHPAQAQPAAGLQQGQRARLVVGQPADAVAGLHAERLQTGRLGIGGLGDGGGVAVPDPCVQAAISSSRSPGSYRHSRPRRSWHSSAVQGSIRLPQRLSR